MKLKHRPDDEIYWATIREQLEPMYTSIQLCNKRRSPAPFAVREKVRAMVDLGMSYEHDEHAPLDVVKESGSSSAYREEIADFFHTSADQIAINRNTMEGVATIHLGLDMKPGDEVIATNLCYDSNIAILRQRAAREGIVIKLANLPFGDEIDDAMVEALAKEITPRTKLISFPHVVAQTGYILPIERICALAREREIFSFVDGAHSAGHFDVKLDELGCDAFATSLHKWMFGPRGTGFLYVRREAISKVWALQAPWSGKAAGDIEKFEEYGTVFKGLAAAIPEAMAFNREMTQTAKTARLNYLRNRWLEPLSKTNRIRPLTKLTNPTGFGAFAIEGMAPKEFADRLRAAAGISVLAFRLDEPPHHTGIHLSPSLSNTIEEVDAFVAATQRILAD